MKNETKTSNQETQTQKGGEKSPTLPNRDELRKWTTRDIEAALYFLSYLRESPTIIDRLVETMMEDATVGQRIGIVTKNDEENG